MAALVHQQTRRHPAAQNACQASRANEGIFKMNIRQPTASPMEVGDSARHGWLRNRYKTANTGIRQGSSGCGIRAPIRTPPRGGKRTILCGGCGARNLVGTTPTANCCMWCGAFYDNGQGSQDTHQILKDTVKGNRAAFLCGGTDKSLGVYGTGTLVMREYSEAPPLPGMVAPSDLITPLRVVQPPPAVKTITAPPRKSYAYSTAELIKKSNTGYDANLSIRSCGTRRTCSGDSNCGCNCSLCCQANIVCDDRSYWADGICPGGLTGVGTSCRTGDANGCGALSGPCKCQNWTYKRRNNGFAANGAVDGSLLTAQMGRVTQVADKCNTEACETIARTQTFPAPNPNACVNSGLLPGTLGQIRRIPQELHQPRRPRPGQP